MATAAKTKTKREKRTVLEIGWRELGSQTTSSACTSCRSNFIFTLSDSPIKSSKNLFFDFIGLPSGK